MNARSTVGLLLAAAFLATPGVAAAKGDQSVRVFASVEESCRFNTTSLVMQDGTTSNTGFADEACNSDRGFTITASTRPLAGDEVVSLRYASNTTSLESDGSTMVARVNGASARRVPFKVDAVRLLAPLTMSLSMNAV